MAGELRRYLEFLAQSQQLKAAVTPLLKTEANILASELQKSVAQYYSIYKPRFYQRQWKLLDSVRIEAGVSNEGNGYSMRVYFDEGASTHPSIVTGKHGTGDDGFVPILLNQGWSWNPDTTSKNGSHFHFSFYPEAATYGDYSGNSSLVAGHGWQFVENAIRQYFASRGTSALPITKVVVYGGRQLERTVFNP